MYRKKMHPKTSLKVCVTYEGETIEQKCARILNNKEGITDSAPLVYTERKDGVNPMHDIRTDRFELAVDGMTNVSKSHLAKREENIGALAKKNMAKEDGKPEPGTGTTDEK